MSESFESGRQPDPYPEPRTSAPKAGRPAQLDDRLWLQTRLLVHGERAVAEELGVSRGAVVRARQRLGITAQTRGRRRQTAPRATTATPSGPPPLPEPIRLIAERFADDTAAPTETVIRDRIIGLVHARGNPQDRIFALTDLASAVALNLEHELMLRRQR